MMVSPLVSAPQQRRPRMRRFLLVALVCAALLRDYRPVRAGYEWCSVDPVFVFQHQGSLLPQALDLQVLVPLTALPLADAATLAVSLPANAVGKEVLNTRTPLFVLRTTITQRNVQATTSRFPVEFVLLVPAAAGEVPVRMLITNVSAGTVTETDGWAGQKLRSEVMVGA